MRARAQILGMGTVGDDGIPRGWVFGPPASGGDYAAIDITDDAVSGLFFGGYTVEELREIADRADSEHRQT